MPCICGDGSFVEATRLHATSDILIFQIPIFDHVTGAGGFKLSVDMSFPFELYMCPPFASSDLGRYTLKAVVTHIGSSLNAGHFFSTIKISGEWWCFNDSNVHQVPALPTGRTYLLFYEQGSTVTPEPSYLSLLSSTTPACSSMFLSTSILTVYDATLSAEAEKQPVQSKEKKTKEGPIHASKGKKAVSPEPSSKTETDSDFGLTGKALKSMKVIGAALLTTALSVKTRKKGKKAVPPEPSSETKTDSDFGPSGKALKSMKVQKVMKKVKLAPSAPKTKTTAMEMTLMQQKLFPKIHVAMEAVSGKWLTIKQLLDWFTPALTEGVVQRTIWDLFQKTSTKSGNKVYWTLPELDLDVAPPTLLNNVLAW
ncbi:hypothetical protein VKT23_012049 [Stygiomarasmius scandens]|uniref:USP domain-containing protein n=1 Tax=Marasmiellus scandens TaxID=2682957 RepID=A0ABR1J7A0_9AGAR